MDDWLAPPPRPRRPPSNRRGCVTFLVTALVLAFLAAALARVVVELLDLLD